MMNDGAQTWLLLLATFQYMFTGPSYEIFIQLATAWTLCPGRRVITRIYQIAEPLGHRAHDAYHRFFSDGAWNLAMLWKLLAKLSIDRLCRAGAIELSLDDTAFHKSGRKVDGAGWWRDAVRSTGQKVVHCFGLNLVVLTYCYTPAWGGEPLGLPIDMRLHRKGGASLLQLAEEMIGEVAGWFPEREFALCADGFYAPLAGASLPRTSLTSRMRRDAAIYQPLPPARGRRQRGRPRKKGQRLPTPAGLAAKEKSWRSLSVNIRGHVKTRRVAVHDVVWYAVCPDKPVRLVLCRDPEGKEEDDFFFTTDLEATAREVIERYGSRWSIEDTFKNTKQLLGAQDPQLWKPLGPERAAAFSLWLYSMIWLHYIQTRGAKPSWIPLPWYPQKKTPSFADALASLRRALWRERIFSNSENRPLPRKMIDTLVEALAYAA